MLLAAFSIGPDVSASSPITTAPFNRRLLVDPSSVSVSLGKARLIVSPLILKGKFCVGDYRLKVVPYFYKNEKGTLKLNAPADTVNNLLKGIPVKFTGTATNNKDQKINNIVGKAFPITKERGSVSFSIATENGLMVFNTSYHFSK